MKKTLWEKKGINCSWKLQLSINHSLLFSLIFVSCDVIVSLKFKLIVSNLFTLFFQVLKEYFSKVFSVGILKMYNKSY